MAILAEDLRLTDDPLVRRDGRGDSYTERVCENCGNLVWMRKASRFCSRTCARLSQDQGGENHYHWAGDDASYNARHKRLHLIKGKASSCYNRTLGLRACSSQIFDWSQLHGSDGLDPLLDYFPLCRPCHHAYDKAGVPRPDLRGSKTSWAKLTEGVVAECRQRHYAAGEAKAALAREFAIDPSTMHCAITGKTWKHVPVSMSISKE